MILHIPDVIAGFADSDRRQKPPTIQIGRSQHRSRFRGVTKNERCGGAPLVPPAAAAHGRRRTFHGPCLAILLLPLLLPREVERGLHGRQKRGGYLAMIGLQYTEYFDQTPVGAAHINTSAHYHTPSLPLQHFGRRWCLSLRVFTHHRSHHHKPPTSPSRMCSCSCSELA